MKPIAQPTAFGRSMRRKDRRFYKIAARWLAIFNRVMFPIVIASFVIFFGLLVYAGIGIEHSETYASDGTVFSCRIDSANVKGKR